MAFTFPSSPSVNDTYAVGSRVYTWTGTKWILTGGVITASQIADGSITAAKIADGTVVAAEIASNAVTTAKILDANVTQAKLGTTLSAVTVTTTANRDTVVTSPFTGQLVFLTDTKKIQVWDGTAWLNITMAPPETPTSLSYIEAPTSVAISFTAGAANGSAITNYKYALSTDGGSTYGSFTALSPADFTTPITVSGLSMNTTYHVKLKAVNDLGDSVASSAVTFTTEGVPAAPTSLSASNITGSTADIAFTAGAANGASITNYKYAVSTDDITYGAYSALSPADASTPVTVTGLTSGTLQYIKLKAVNSNGDSAASAAVSLTTLATPGAPTSLSTGSITATSVAISFTPGAQGGSAITNYQYALSTNSGSTYGSFTALATPDATSPITVDGLTQDTSYYIKLKAVNTAGAGTESSAVSFTTLLAVDYLVVAGGGGGGYRHAAGGGAGGLRSTVTNSGGPQNTLETPLGVTLSTNYTVTIGGGGGAQASGENSVFSTITSIGGGYGGSNGSSGAAGGSGGGGTNGGAGGIGTAYQGHNGDTTTFGGGGGGSGGAGYGGLQGGSGRAVAITGSSVTYAGGGGGGGYTNAGQGPGSGAAGGGSGGFNTTGYSATVNSGSGGGGGGAEPSFNGGSGGSGIVILRYLSSKTLTLGAGLTGSTATDGSSKVTTITAGSGNVSWA